MNAPPRSSSLTIDVAPGSTAFSVAERIAAAAPGRSCAFAAGDLPADVTMTSVQLRTGNVVMDGGIVCGDGVDGLLRHPTVHDAAMVGFASGELRVVHGSDTSVSAPLSELLADGPHRAMLTYVAQPRSLDDATKLLDSVRAVLRPYVVFVWLVSD